MLDSCGQLCNADDLSHSDGQSGSRNEYSYAHANGDAHTIDADEATDWNADATPG